MGLLKKAALGSLIVGLGTLVVAKNKKAIVSAEKKVAKLVESPRAGSKKSAAKSVKKSPAHKKAARKG